MDTPNVARGARFWGYHVKPADTGGSTLIKTDDIPTATPPQTLLSEETSGEDLWFAPTQVAVGITTDSGGSARDVTIEIQGVDQFGFDVDETVEFSSVSGGQSVTIGTKYCYTHLTTVTLTAASNLDPDDTYSLGVSRDDADKYRIPLPARVRGLAGVKAVQNVTDSNIYEPADDMASSTTIAFIDIERQAAEIEISDANEKILAVILDPGTTAI